MPHLRKGIAFLLGELKFPSKEIVFHFVTQSKICRLHKEYFNDPSPTDCITFPLDSAHTLGEAFICPKVAIEYARAHNLDTQQEIWRYIIHCLLHIQGYTDSSPSHRKTMKRKENHYLKKLRSKNL